jgi:DNA-binding SARP family transcriptional activator/tetratricopeptide (TPR) repeat protein
VRIRLLGPVEITVRGAARPVPGLRRRAVLAVLGLHAGDLVGVDQLIDVVWGTAPPAGAANALQRHVSYLRGVLDTPGCIVSRPPGYVLDLPDGGTDVALAEALIRRAGQALDRAAAAAHLRTALALWRGRPLDGTAGLPWLAEQAERLARMRLEVVTSLVEHRLALGEHAELVPELDRLAGDHPFEEPIHGQLMLALYRGGRPVEALAAYGRLARTLGDELGIDPGPPLRRLEAEIRRRDPALDLPAPAIRSDRGSTPVVAAQLPAVTPSFTGRSAELAMLDRARATSGPAAAAISVISGTAGVGKTALAVHWAHRATGEFPDGQLYANLRGFTPGGTVADPAEALRGFLEALGVAPDRIPSDVATRSALYRSALSGRRVLVVLDNAHDADQVRPLLPGSTGCLALVTSRNQLTSLVAVEGARPVTLDLLPPDEARALLAARLGAARLAAEPGAVEQILARCAGLPLALSIVAARAVARPGFGLADLVAELLGPDRALDPFTGGDATTDVRAVFSWSYRTLCPDAARLFRMLALHPGPDIGAAAVVSLAGEAPARVRRLVTELTGAHLLSEPVPGRYAFHDLLRAYATELAQTTDGPGARRAVQHRTLDHYLHTAESAARLRHPPRRPTALEPPRAGVVAEPLADDAQASAWLGGEEPVLIALVARAADLGFDAHAYHLAAALVDHLERRGHWRDQVAIQHIALAAAGRMGDPGARAAAHRRIATASIRLNHIDDALTHLERALDLFAAAGDHDGEAFVHLDLAEVRATQGANAESLEHDLRALALFRVTGNRAGQGRALNDTGWSYCALGRPELALHYCEQGLALLREADDRLAQAATLDSLGLAHHGLGDHARAIARYEQSLRIYRDAGARYGQADTLNHLGDTLVAAGQVDRAGRAWWDAVDILVDLRHPAAGVVRAKLDAVGRSRPRLLSCLAG